MVKYNSVAIPEFYDLIKRVTDSIVGLTRFEFISFISISHKISYIGGLMILKIKTHNEISYRRCHLVHHNVQWCTKFQKKKILKQSVQNFHRLT